MNTKTLTKRGRGAHASTAKQTMRTKPRNVTTRTKSVVRVLASRRVNTVGVSVREISSVRSWYRIRMRTQCAVLINESCVASNVALSTVHGLGIFSIFSFVCFVIYYSRHTCSTCTEYSIPTVTTNTMYVDIQNDKYNKLLLISLLYYSVSD